MADAMIRRLRRQSSRGDYASMVRLAKALYARGLNSRDVLRACYGVDFPEEFFVIAEEFFAVAEECFDDYWGRMVRPRLSVEFTGQPWGLGVPPSRGGPVAAPSLKDPVEKRIFACDRDLVPLMGPLSNGNRWSHSVFCYRLSQLRVGHSTIFVIGNEAGRGSPVTFRSASLLEALHAHHTEYLRVAEGKRNEPGDWKEVVLTEWELDELRAAIERVEELLTRPA
ncbi:MAG TPA: hypothetical protein VFV66_20455 [Nonomuraea sp.]|nr:hypothetical protein [Nonomuraea sp.]